MKIACSIYSVPAYEASNGQEHMCISDNSSPFIYEIIMNSMFSFKLKGFRSQYRKMN
jgi:hypothetical protein